ncbi:MAG TPA: glutamate--tRNA ligase [Candidatus Bathyarchaeia archaeon]|nr:glutamate--tRNA ligase [Candidatus Bathyarchaeia archaeon]
MQVRVRIAPTPSGKLHLGTAHTALFNYLFARHHAGQFILRIDDSDPSRCKKEYEEDIIESLKWLGIEWDEGPDIAGPYGPYRQSQRMNIYKKYIDCLLKEGKAYYCYCTPEELTAERKKMEKAKIIPRYSGKCRHLTVKQVESFKKQNRKPAVRLKVPEKMVSFIDPARGKIAVNSADFGDFIIARGDGTALLGMASTIDDIEMKITHAIRGEDYINFVPRQILIYEALGIKPPIFAHLPFVYAADGSKLSKRHGAVAVSDYRKKGYLPEAIFNYLTFLGWSTGDDRDILTKKETIKLFRLEKVNTNAHHFDVNKLKWLNGVYIRNTSDEKLLWLTKPHLDSQLSKIENQQLRKIIPLLKERIFVLSEVKEMIQFLKTPPDCKKELFKGEKVEEQLQQLEDSLKTIKDWQKSRLFEAIKGVFGEGNYDKKEFYPNLYLAIEGRPTGLPVFESMEILGKAETLKRLKKTLNLVATTPCHSGVPTPCHSGAKR